MNFKSSLLLTALTLQLFLTATAYPAETAPQSEAPFRLFMLPFHNASGESDLKYLAESAGDLLLTCLSTETETFSVVHRDSFEERGAELAMNMAVLSTKQLAGNMLGASHLVRGSLIQRNNNLFFNTLVFDLRTTGLVHAQQLPLTNFDLDRGTCQQWVFDLENSLASSHTQTQEELFDRFPERTAQLNEGISRLHNGEKAQAMAIFLNLERQFPNDPNMSYWLSKSFFQAGLFQPAALQAQSFLEAHPEDPRADTLRLYINHTSASSADKEEVSR
jgi:TolB-like protein